ncbi:hypothetical protein PO909_014112, partial [Leuciscus waleckii]
GGKCPSPSSACLRYDRATPCDTRCVRITSQRAADVTTLMSRRLATAQNQIASQSGRQQTPMNKQHHIPVSLPLSNTALFNLEPQSWRNTLTHHNPLSDHKTPVVYDTEGDSALKG